MSVTRLNDAELLSRIAEGGPEAFRVLAGRVINGLLAWGLVY